MRFDCHMHTPLCGHAVGDPVEYVAVARQRGLGLITFSCHIPIDEPTFGGPGIRMRRDQLPAYLAMVAEARAYGEMIGVEVLTGIEAEVFPDHAVMKVIDEVLDAHPFDFVLGSLHHQLPAWRGWVAAKGIKGDAAIIRAYFAHLTLGAKSGRYHSIAHPDVIRLYGTLSGPFEPAAFEDEIRTFIQATIDADICMEINTSGMIKGDRVMHPDPLILKWALEMGAKFTIGSDSHAPEMVAQYFEPCIERAQSLGMRTLHYYRSGVRVPVAL